MPFPRRPLFPLLVLFAVAGCAAEDRAIVPETPRLDPVELLRIGSLDDPETALTSIRAVELGPDGRVYTLHNRERIVRMFSPDGTLIGSLGGRGEGPGEFESPITMDLIDDELRVLDMRTLRLSRFDLDGELVGELTYRRKPFEHAYLRPPRPLAALSDLTFLGEYAMNTLPGSEERTDNPFMRLAADGEILDTVFNRSVEGDYLILDVGIGEPTVTGPPYGWGPIATAAPARMELVVAEREVFPEDPHFRVMRMTLDGDTLWSRRYSYEPVPIDPEVVEFYVDNFARVVDQAGWTSYGNAEEVYRGGMIVPEHTPPLDRVVIGRDGSIWLQLADNDDTRNRWLVLDEAGDVHAEVDLRERFFIRHATLEALWGMELDELDVPYLVHYALEVQEGER